MAQAPSGRPPSDGWPETRGSHLAGEQERERAIRRLELGKTRNQKRAERNNRKRSNGRRKHQQRLDDASRSQPVEQQSLSETEIKSGAGTTRDGAPFPEEKAAALRTACVVHKRSTIADWLIANFYATRNTKNPRRAAYEMIARAIGCSTMSQHTHRVLDRCIAAHPVDADPSDAVVKFEETDRVAMLERQFAAFHEESNRRFDKLVELIAQRAVALPEKRADVVPMRPARELLVDLVKGASVGDGLYKQRWRHLWSTFELENEYDFDARAKELNIDTTKRGWHLDMAETDKIIDSLLTLARKLFGASAARNKS